jgi:hypothetical protein
VERSGLDPSAENTASIIQNMGYVEGNIKRSLDDELTVAKAVISADPLAGPFEFGEADIRQVDTVLR